MVCRRCHNPLVHTVTLKASGHQFAVAPGETVLEAAQRAGIALDYSCRGGVCGSCKATLLEGICDYPRSPPAALSMAEQVGHSILTCQAVPRGNVTIAAREVASVADIPRVRMDVRVAAKTQLAPDVIGLHLQPLGDVPFRWLAGQYLDIMLDDGKRRPFSIACGPRPDGGIELHVRHVAGGGFTSFVHDTLEAGDRLSIEGPQGTFVPREDSERPMIFMAGGTGFAPVKAIVEHFLALGTRREMDIYWGARVSGDLYLRELAKGWATRAHVRFHPVVSEAAEAAPASLRAGLVHEAVLEDHPDLSEVEIYMSGPPPMIAAGRECFIAAGLPETRLYFDSFDYAPDVLEQILRARSGIHGL
jgi:CDP-4-dehydro-6-deoxyglucose reductase